MPRLSIIIPTYRRAEILAECLRRIDRQTVVADLEVIVVGDGHDDKTAALFAKKQARAGSDQREAISGEWTMPVRYLEIPKSQQGSARNEGVKQAKGEHVLFIGDDIFLEQEACEMHLKAHTLPLASLAQGESCAALGFTTWDPACGITPVMRWLERSGWQFGYPKISRYAHGPIPENFQHQFTYTSHISLPLAIAKKTPFRTDVHLYGWEDVEWGMRLRNAGVRLIYEPAARAFHHHHLMLEDSLKRMEILGRSAVELRKTVPGFDRVPTGWKLLAYRIAALLPTMAGKHRKAFLSGILHKDALRYAGE